jgi:hypothetical protein
MEVEGAQVLDDLTRQTLVAHASRLTIKHSKLGDRSLHDNNEISLSDLRVCGNGSSIDAPGSPSGASVTGWATAALLLFGASLSLLI